MASLSSAYLLLAMGAVLAGTGVSASAWSAAFLSGGGTASASRANSTPLSSSSSLSSEHPVRRLTFGHTRSSIHARRTSWTEYEHRLAAVLQAAATSSSSDDGDDNEHSEQSESESESESENEGEEGASALDRSNRNRAYLTTLRINLSSALEAYQSTYRQGDVRRAINILRQMEREVMSPYNDDRVEEARRMCRLAGLDPSQLEGVDANDDGDVDNDGDDGDNELDDSNKDKVLRIDNSDTARRRADADARRRWEATRPGGISPGMNTVHPGEYTTTNRMEAGAASSSNSRSSRSRSSVAEGVKNGLHQGQQQGQQQGQPQESPMGASRDRRAEGRSILSTRSATDDAMLGGLGLAGVSGEQTKKKSFPGNVVATGSGNTAAPSSSRKIISGADPAQAANDIQGFRESMEVNGIHSSVDNIQGFHESMRIDAIRGGTDTDAVLSPPSGEEQASELVALAGSGGAFQGATLGIGGLDDVLNQIKRRVWVPLAAPPSLLAELGISPVRGLLLYGSPGCGKTLLARSLGKILSPARPITVVSGPEVMDRFVGSSEANLREIFDSPPPIHDSFRVQFSDMGAALEKSALSVIVLDEFDAIARSRGGGDGKGGQGDAGVARDSVVNQMLAKMDGVDPLPVPTLVIGLTNKRSLIDPALLRPGRFEVQIEVPKPKNKEQRISILKVHLNSMMGNGRLLVSDPPPGTAAARVLESGNLSSDEFQPLLSFDQLVDLLAVESEGFTGASLAAVARAAASHALERAVFEIQEGGSITDCLVTQQDFELAIDDCIESEGDGGEDEKKDQTNDDPQEDVKADDADTQ